MKRCILSFTLACGLTLLTVASAWANGYATDEAGNLYQVTPATKKFTRLGRVVAKVGKGAEAYEETPSLTDIALSTTHGLYGISFSSLYKIEITDPAKSKRIGELGSGAMFNALAFDPDGLVLYALGGDALYRVDHEKGTTKLIGRVGSGGSSDGDLAFIGDQLVGTFSTGRGCLLVRIDIKTGKGTAVGIIRRQVKAPAATTPKKDGPTETTTPVYSVWGLIYDGHKTWALTSDGHVLELDPKTAIVKPVFRMPIRVYGACPMLRL